MKLDIPNKEIKKEVMKYVMNKIRKECKDQVEILIDDALSTVDVKSHDYDKLSKKLEKIQDYINDNFGETKGRLYL